jgi:Cupin-like domain
MDYRCLAPDLPVDRFDREAFKFQHQLLGHPALSLEHLAKMLPRLERGQVSYSSARMSEKDHFESFFYQHGDSASVEAAIESIRTSEAYIAVQAPQTDSSYTPIFNDLLRDIGQLLRLRGVGQEARNPRMYLFIASPNAVTPFHFDRYANFLMQFRGRKTVSVFPQWNPNVIPDADREAYVTYANTHLNWSPALDQFGTAFDFGPGEALHIPFAAGHHVRNGPDDVSISLSIFFDTDENLRWRRAMSFNHYARRVMRPLGAAPGPVGHSPLRDGMKSALWSGLMSPSLDAVRSLRKRLSA